MSTKNDCFNEIARLELDIYQLDIKMITSSNLGTKANLAVSKEIKQKEIEALYKLANIEREGGNDGAF